MKALFIGYLLAALCFVAAGLILAGERPTREYKIWYDNGQTTVIEADSVDEALRLFNETVKHERVYSVAQRSYVTSDWIGN